MYTGFELPLDYSHPWEQSHDLRQRWLTRSDLRVAYVYENADSSTFRYRVFNMVDALRANPERQVSASWFTRQEFHDDASFVDAADVLVVCRTRYDDALARMVERARSRGVLVLFDIDDLMFDVGFAPLIVHVLEQPMAELTWDFWFGVIARLHATLELCDGVIVTNWYLAERMRAHFPDKPCQVVTNHLNRWQTEESDRLFQQKRAGGFRRDGRVTVGYFSGSHTHNADLLMASPAIAGAMAEHPDLYLRIVGYLDLNPVLEPFADRIEQLPLQDYINLQRVTAACEFSVAPLQMNTFTCCKSELKYFEPAIVGCPVIATPIPTFEDAIVDGVNGHLARSHEWRDRIEQLYEGVKTDSPAFHEMMAKASDHAHRAYAWDSQIDAVLGAFTAIRNEVGGRSDGALRWPAGGPDNIGRGAVAPDGRYGAKSIERERERDQGQGSTGSVLEEAT